MRRQVPTLDLRAKLFGSTPDAPLYWRCADVVIARPTDRSVTRTLLVGARMVAFMPQDSYAEGLARAMESRRLGTSAGNALLLSSALEPLLRKKARNKDSRIGSDGAGNIADAVWIVANERLDVLEERRASARANTRSRVEAAAAAAEAASHVSAAAGGLEDLSGGMGDLFSEVEEQAPDSGEIAALRAEVRTRLQQASKTVAEAREAAARWQKRVEATREKGDKALTRKAERAYEAENARMHAALAEMAQLQSELDRLEKADQKARSSRSGSSRSSGRSSGGRSSGRSSSGSSKRTSGKKKSSSRSGRASGSSRSSSSGKSLDDMLQEMRNSKAQEQATIDDELAELKRKMRNKKKR